MEKDLYNCEYIHIHQDIVDKVNENMPAEEVLFDLAEFFKVFADSTRIKILYVLLQSEMCVCDIGQTLNISQSAVSHQLRMLKQMRLVKYRKEGKSVLTIAVGCTGGQHRSVYSAEHLAAHLVEKYGVRIMLNHREQGISQEFV